MPQTPLKQKHPFSSENKPPSQDLHEWATSAGRGSSNEGQDVPLRTHLRRAEGQKPVYIDPPSVSLSLSSFTLPPWPERLQWILENNKKKSRPPPPACPLHPLPPPALLSCSQRGSEGGRGTVLSKQRQRGKDFP